MVSFSRHPYLETPLNRRFMASTWWKPEAVTQESQRLRRRGRRRLNGLSLLFQTTPVSSKLASRTTRYEAFLSGSQICLIRSRIVKLNILFGWWATVFWVSVPPLNYPPPARLKTNIQKTSLSFPSEKPHLVLHVPGL